MPINKVNALPNSQKQDIYQQMLGPINANYTEFKTLNSAPATYYPSSAASGYLQNVYRK